MAEILKALRRELPSDKSVTCKIRMLPSTETLDEQGNWVVVSTICFFSPRKVGEEPILTFICFRGVGSTTNYRKGDEVEPWEEELPII